MMTHIHTHICTVLHLVSLLRVPLLISRGALGVPSLVGASIVARLASEVPRGAVSLLLMTTMIVMMSTKEPAYSRGSMSQTTCTCIQYTYWLQLQYKAMCSAALGGSSAVMPLAHPLDCSSSPKPRDCVLLLNSFPV